MRIGQGIARAALVAGATVLEIFDKPAAGLWAVIVVWVFLADWHLKEIGKDD